MKSWITVGNPVVSICCTTYNHEKYISKAIESFLMQMTDFPFEIIIRDDCSTDSTADIIKRYVEKYPNIVKPIFETENTYSQGIRPMPVVFAKATGKYLALCEGDDYWTDPNKLQKQIAFLENNPDYVITYTDCEFFDRSGSIKNTGVGATRDLEAIELQKCTPIYTLTVCFRNVLKDTPPELHGARIGDLCIWSLLGHYGKGKFLSDIKPAKYRVHDGGILSTKTKRQKLIMLQITSGALYAYYNRINNQDLANHFQKINIVANLKVIGFFPLLKIITQNIPKKIFTYVIRQLIVFL